MTPPRTDAQPERVAPLPPGKVGDPNRSGAGSRLFLEAVLFVTRTGTGWRDLRPDNGNRNSIYQRFCRCSLKGVAGQIFATLSGDPDFEYVPDFEYEIVDGPIVRVQTLNEKAAAVS